MPPITRILPRRPVVTFDAHQAEGGGRGLATARRLGAASVVDEVEASGLRGRGGAGFPTGVKWRTVADSASAMAPATVVVNGAEGEPGSFKDRTLMRRAPYEVVEGTLIAALAVGADRAVIAVKGSFMREAALLEQAIEDARRAAWCDGVSIAVVAGPEEYLFGEETALLEVLDGRPPFPRLAAPYRHGVDEVGTRPDEPGGTWLAPAAQPGRGGPPPTLVDNVETVANLPHLLARGADWFRSLGTAESPGSIVCTVSGDTRRAGVAEFAMGTPLLEVITELGSGPHVDRRLVAAMSGVANPVLPATLFDTPLTYEHMESAGSGLGAAGFIVFDDHADMAAVAAGVARFLGVESCGQCTPCKQDGLAMSVLLRDVAGSSAGPAAVSEMADRVRTVADESRCNLASQQERVVGSVLRLFPDALAQHVDGRAAPVDPAPIVPIVDITADGGLVLDRDHQSKQPDWTRDEEDSGKSPVDRLASPVTHMPS